MSDERPHCFCGHLKPCEYHPGGLGGPGPAPTSGVGPEHGARFVVVPFRASWGPLADAFSVISQQGVPLTAGPIGKGLAEAIVAAANNLSTPPQPCVGGQACDAAHRCIDPEHCSDVAAPVPEHAPPKWPTGAARLEALVMEYTDSGECKECGAEVCRSVKHDPDCVIGQVEAALRDFGGPVSGTAPPVTLARLLADYIGTLLATAPDKPARLNKIATLPFAEWLIARGVRVDRGAPQPPPNVWAEVVRFLAEVGDGANPHSAKATRLYGVLGGAPPPEPSTIDRPAATPTLEAQ